MGDKTDRLDAIIGELDALRADLVGVKGAVPISQHLDHAASQCHAARKKLSALEGPGPVVQGGPVPTPPGPPPPPKN